VEKRTPLPSRANHGFGHGACSHQPGKKIEEKTRDENAGAHRPSKTGIV
jgi:hypothetical protein